jgi:hypothetical protein
LRQKDLKGQDSYKYDVENQQKSILIQNAPAPEPDHLTPDLMK